MGLEVFIAPIIGILIIWGLIKLINLPFWILKNSIIGAVMLYISNFIGIFTIKITFAGVFGIPGIIGLILFA